MTSLAALGASPGAAKKPGHGRGCKTQRLAARSSDVQPVLAALDLERPRQVPWNDGVEPPPVEGRVPVRPDVTALPSIGSTDDRGYGPALRLLERLGARTGGEAQHLGTRRPADGHAWAIARDGRITRAFNLDGGRGEVDLAPGELADAARVLGLVALADDDPSARFAFLLDAGIEVDEEWPHTLAASWSIDPLSFGAARAAPPSGWRANGPGAR